MLALLDRDGVLNEDRPDYVKNPGELVMVSGAAEAVARLNGAGIRVAVVTNQACVGKGIIDLVMLDLIHQHLRTNLARAGARIDEIFFCPDPPWAPTEYRKPNPGMLRQALTHFNTDPAAATMVGDSLRDLEAAAAAGCRRVLVRTGKGGDTQAAGLPPHVLPVAVHDDLAAVVDSFLAGQP